MIRLTHHGSSHNSKPLSNKLGLLRELHEKSVLEFLGLVLRYFSEVSEVKNHELKAAAIAATSPDIGEQVMETLAVQWMREGRQQGRQEGLQEGLQQGLSQGLQQGTQTEANRLALLILGRRCGPLPQKTVTRINALSVPQLEALIEASLDFTKRKDLDNWLKTQPATSRKNLSN